MPSPSRPVNPTYAPLPKVARFAPPRKPRGKRIALTILGLLIVIPLTAIAVVASM